MGISIGGLQHGMILVRLALAGNEMLHSLFSRDTQAARLQAETAFCLLGKLLRDDNNHKETPGGEPLFHSEFLDTAVKVKSGKRTGPGYPAGSLHLN